MSNLPAPRTPFEKAMIAMAKKDHFNRSKNAPSKQGQLFTANPNVTVQLQAEFDAAEMLTVQFDVIPPPIAGPPPLVSEGVFDTVADVTFTVQGGGTVRRTLSIGSGTTISGPGQNCTVTIRDQTTPFFAVGVPYTVMAQVSPGSRPSTGLPPTLEGFPTIQTLLGGAFASINIPSDAGVTSVQVVTAVPVVADYPIQSYVEIGNFGFVLSRFDPTIYTGFVKIPPNATIVNVQNISVREMQFQLTWGIDG